MDDTPNTPTSAPPSTSAPTDTVAPTPATKPAPETTGQSVDGFVRRPINYTSHSDITNNADQTEVAPAPTSPPVSAPVASAPEVAEPAESVAPQEPITPKEEPATEVHEAPIPVQVSAESESVDEESHNPLDKLEEVPQEEVPETNPEGKVTAAPIASKKSKGHGAAILVAVMIALSLIGGAGYAYWQNQKTKTSNTQTTQKTEEVKKNPATAEDVQKGIRPHRHNTRPLVFTDQ